MSVCVCVRVCVCAGMCVHTCVYACMYMYYEHMHANMCMTLYSRCIYAACVPVIAQVHGIYGVRMSTSCEHVCTCTYEDLR